MKTFFSVLFLGLFTASISEACPYLQVTYYHKMCQTTTCGYLKPATGLAKLAFDEKLKSQLSEVIEVAPGLQIKYQIQAEKSRDNRFLYLKVSTSFVRAGRTLIHSEKSDMIVNAKDFAPILLEGEPFISAGYKWMPYFEVHPEPNQRDCR